MLTNILVALICLFYTRTLKRRAEIVTVCLKGWLTACATIIALYLYDAPQSSASLLGDIGSSGVFMLLTAVLVVGLLPLFESAFRVLTDINLMEYMNPNQELLRRLMVEAPGTYQHSLLLGITFRMRDHFGKRMRLFGLYHIFFLHPDMSRTETIP